MAGEYTGDVLLKGVTRFIEIYAPGLLQGRPLPAAARRASAGLALPDGNRECSPSRPRSSRCSQASFLLYRLPGTPHLYGDEADRARLGPHHVSCDIGCHLFSILPPFNIGATTMGYVWAGPARPAFNTSETSRRTIAVMGDGGFWHNGLTSGVGNAVFNRTDNLLLVVDNGYAAATGGQDVPSSQADSPSSAPGIRLKQRSAA